MANVHFRLRGKTNHESIYLQLTIDRKNRFEKKTGLGIDAKDWSKETKLPKQNLAKNKNLNSTLRKLEVFILDSVNQAQINGDTINTGWLGRQIDIHFKRIDPSGKSELVTDAIKYVLDTAELRKNSSNGLGLSKSRVNGYRSLLRIWSKFEGSRSIKVREVDIKMGKDFLKFLLSDMDYSQGYAMRLMGNLKTVCYDAEVNGIEVSHQLKKIDSGKTKNDSIVYLTSDELEQIEKAKIVAPYLQNARNWLLLGCNIGQRGSDLLSLTESNFVERSGLKVIEMTQQKTGKQVTIPILEKTERILNEGLPRKISIQRFNDYIKEVCKIAGIDNLVEGYKKDPKTNRKKKGNYPKFELITSHVCRRSFASNQYGILPTPLIMQVTAHGTEKTFLGYIGKSGLDYARQIADFYELQKAKNKKETKLKIIKSKSN